MDRKRRRTTGRTDGIKGPRAKWKSVWFECCHVYGRIYRNVEATRYEGRCPKCGGRVHAVIGPHGTSQHIFRAI